MAIGREGFGGGRKIARAGATRVRRAVRAAPRGARRAMPTLAVAAIASPLALLLALGGAAALIGGGFGDKRLGMASDLHSDAPLVMAHRGLDREHPENSRAALLAARAAGFDAVEIDVKRSADGHFYLFHDRRSMRLLGVDIDLARQSLDELERYPLHHAGRATDQRILSLQAFAREFADDFVVYLDIKRHGNDDYRTLADELAGFLERHALRERAIVGGDFLFVTYFEYRFPALHTSLGSPGDFRARAYRWIPWRFRPDFMVSRFAEITPGLVRWLERSDLIDRWIVHGVNASNRERVESRGFSKLLVD